MNIDKTRFLLLASTLAASTGVAVGVGCTVNATSTDTGSDASAPTDGAVTTTPTDSGLGNSTDGGACLADVGSAPVCVSGSPCEPECNTANEFFKADVAASINGCIFLTMPAPTTEADCTAAAPACVEAALGRACDDATAADFCTTFLASCPDQEDAGSPATLQADCVGFARGMSTTGRTDLQNCVTQDQRTCADCIAAVKAVSGTQ